MQDEARTGHGRRQDPTPEWAYEPVHVVEPDRGWARAAERYRDELDDLLGDRLAGPAVHVGSTAVPGLPAKPIIDLQAETADPAAVVESRRDVLSDAHWHLVPRHLDRRPWRWLVVRTDPQGRRRRAHLHLMRPGESRWHQQIVFRDRLRASADLVGEYARLKAAAARCHRDDREAYTRAKAAFVRRVVDDDRPG